MNESECEFLLSINDIYEIIKKSRDVEGIINYIYKEAFNENKN